VAGARGLLVAALQPTGDEPPQHGYAPGTDGTFDDPSAPPGTATLRFSAKGFAKSATPVVLTAGRTTNVEITLIPESSCRGTVRDGKGDPVRGRRVTAAPVGSTTPVAAAVSNATGEFVLAGLAAGRFVISVVGTPGKPAAETTLELAEGETATWDPVVDTAGPPK
jgi:hypothetical protein